MAAISRSGLNPRKVDWRWFATGVLIVFLAACAGPPPAPQQPQSQPGTSPDDAHEDVQKKVREPARQDSKGVQVYPLQNPAVKSLMEQAQEAEDQGNYDLAAVSLERAMRIQPGNPELLQAMAEVQLHKKDYEQALNFAVRSYDSGARVGELCSRNWRTIAVARQRLGDSHGSEEAMARANNCMNTKPQSY